MRIWDKSRLRLWLHALIVGVLMTAQFQLFTAEALHHHEENTQACRIAHTGQAYLHAVPALSPVCPLCQIARNGAVRPSVQSFFQRPDFEAAFQGLICESGYSARFSEALQARGPPLS